MISAHRGAPSMAPENTLASFKEALELNVDFIELDVRASRDGVLVVIHDEYVDRTTNGHGKVCDLLYREIKSLDAGSWFSQKFRGERIPTLRQALKLLSFGEKDIILDIKTKGIEQKALDLIHTMGLGKKTWISASDINILRNVRKKDHHIKLMYIVSDLDMLLIETLKRIDVSMVAPKPNGIVGKISLFQNNGILINLGVVNRISDLLLYLEKGVRVFTSDKPEIVSVFKGVL